MRIKYKKLRKYRRKFFISGILFVCLLIIFFVSNNSRLIDELSIFKSHASTPGPYLTLLFSRSEITAADNCLQNDTNIARLDTVVAPYLHTLGMAGTGTIETGKTQTTAYFCTHFNDTLAISWNTASKFATQYGWHFVSHTATFPANIESLSSIEQYAQTCGSAAALVAHNLPGAHGLIAYPGAGGSPTTVQSTYGQRCFAWGRKYNPSGTTDISAAKTYPYWQHTAAVNGGDCNDTTAACYTFSAPGTTRYTLPSTMINKIKALQPGQWFSLQAFILVTGKNPPYTKNGTKWNCTSPYSTLHWTNDEERYCYNDYVKIVNALATFTNIKVVDPLTVGVAFGRPATYK